MKSSIFVVLCFFVLHSFGQTDSASARDLQLGYTSLAPESRLINPVFVIKGDDIRRFPALNFLEVVNGLFPWVFSFEPRANEFLYVVDGNIFTDINALSLYNIEEIAFVRGGLETGNYPFAKRGSFIIRTKPKASLSSFEFNTNIGLQYLKASGPYFIANNSNFTYDSARTKGLWQNYYLAYSGKAGKANYNLSANFTHDKNPPVLLRQFSGAETTFFNYKHRSNVFKLYAGAAIPLLPSLQFDLQGIADLQHSKIHSTRSISPGDFLTITNNDLPEQYYTFLSSLNWKINKTFSNKFSFAYSNNKERMEFEAISTSSFTDRYSNFIKDTTRVKRGYIESNTVFHPKKKGVLKLNAGLLLRYNFVNFRKGHIGLGFINNQLNTAEGAITKGVTKIITGVPYINLEYKNLASIYGGVQLFLSDVETHSQSNLKGASKRLPYGGIVFSLMNIARRKMTINRLDLGVHYSLRNSNMSDYYRLEKQETPEQFFPAGPYTANSPDDFNKDKVFNLQFITGFYEDRFMIGAEWFKATEAKFFRLPLPPSPFPTYISVLSDVKTKGFSIFGKASLLRGNKHSWNIRFNMVKQDNTSSVDYFEPVIYYPVTAGLQNSVTIGEFFLQLNAVMGLNKTVPVYFVEPKKRADDFSINYALFGYRFSFNKTWMSNMQLFVQAKNIITSKNKDSYISWPKYIGAGLNLSF